MGLLDRIINISMAHVGSAPARSISAAARWEQPFQMVDCIIEYCRIAEAQHRAIEEFVRHVAEGADSLTACVGKVIKALFQLAPTLLFSISCNGLGRTFT